jgi:hypothetical protein
MYLRSASFDSLARAKGFKEGIEFVNDDDLLPHDPVEENGQLVVYVHDWRPIAPDDTCPICGASNEAEGDS